MAILTAFTPARPTLGLGEIARLTGLTRSTTHRILSSLVEHQLVSKVGNDGRYALGPRLLRLASTVTATMNVTVLARPIMTRLRDDTGETVGLHVMHSYRRVVVDQVESRATLRRTYTEIGEALPLHQGAPGKILLAHCPPDVQERLMKEGLEAATANTIVDSLQLSKDLRGAVKRGYAVSHGERVPDINTVAAPVFNFEGRAVASISVTGPSSRLTRKRLLEIAPATVEAARELSGLLGNVPSALPR